MESEQIKINGIAIRPGKSRNGITYSREELNNFSKTMENRPILVDHKSDDYTKNIGLITNSSSINGIVKYEGWIKDSNMGVIERIKDKRLKEVSIGAHVERIVEDEKGEIYAEGLTCMELSIVSCPGVKGTSLQQALESNKKQFTISESFDINEEVNNMAEDEVNTETPVEPTEPVEQETPTEPETTEEPATEEEPVETELEPEAEPAEETPAQESHKVKVEIDTSAIDEALEKVNRLNDAKNKLSEKVNKVEDIKENTKGKIVKETPESTTEKTESTYRVEQCSYGEGASLWKEPSDDGKLI